MVGMVLGEAVAGMVPAEAVVGMRLGSSGGDGANIGRSGDKAMEGCGGG